MHRSVEIITVVTGAVASSTILFILPVLIYESLAPPRARWQRVLNAIFVVFGVTIGTSGLALHFVEDS